MQVDLEDIRYIIDKIDLKGFIDGNGHRVLITNQFGAWDVWQKIRAELKDALYKNLLNSG